MAWLRFDLRALRAERPWQTAIYQAPPQPLSDAAERDAQQLVELVARLTATRELDAWNIAHADLAFALLRLDRNGDPLPAPARRLLEANLARASVHAYVDPPRPPHPPPSAVAWVS